MIKKLLLPLIGILLIIGVQTSKSQCSFTVDENVSLSHLTTLSTCSVYNVTYTLVNSGTTNILCPFTISIHLPDSIYSNGSGFNLYSNDGATYTSSFTNTYIPLVTINTTTSGNWNIGDTIKITFQLSTPCCVSGTKNQNDTIFLSSGCHASPSNSLTVVPPNIFVGCQYPGAGYAYENIGDVVDLVFKIKNKSGTLPINQYVNAICPTVSFMNRLGYFFSRNDSITHDTATNYCHFDSASNFVWNNPHHDTIQANSLTYTSLFGTGYLPADSVYYLHILYQITECTSPGPNPLSFLLYCSSGGSNPNCYPADTVTTNINVATGTPVLGLSLVPPVYINSLHANYCNGGNVPSVTFGFILKNTGFSLESSPGAKGNSFADSIKLKFDVLRELGIIDTTSFKINGYSVPSTLPKLVSKTSTVSTYELDLSKLHYYCDTAFGNNSLADINGRGSLDELSDIPGANTFTVTVNFEYQPYPTSCPTSFSQCGGTTDYPVFISFYYQNQCGFQEPGNNGGYLYQATSGVPQLNSSSLDIVQGDPPILLQLCPENYIQKWADTGYHFICPHADDRIILNLPPGYEVDFSDSIFETTSHYFRTPLIITSSVGCNPDTVRPHVYQYTSRTSCDTNEAIIDFGNLKQCNSANQFNQTYNLPCFYIPLKLICNSCSNVSRGWDNLSYTLSYFCDTSACASCGSQITCKNIAIFHHCSGNCNPGNDFEPNPPFTFKRQTLGWVDTIPANYYSYHNLPKLNVDSVALADPWIRLDRAYPGDKILASDSASLDTTLSVFDSVIFQMCYTVSGWAANSFADTSVFDFDTTGSYVIVGDAFHHKAVLRCPVLQRSHDRILHDGNVQMSFTFNADSNVNASLKNLKPPYYLISHIFLIAKVSPQSKLNGSGVYNFYQPGQYPLTHLQAQWRGNYAYPNTNDTDNSCDPWTANFTILQPDIGITFSGNSSTCAQYQQSLVMLVNPALNPLPDFPYEFRPYAILDSNIKMVIPPWCKYNTSQIIAFQDKYNASWHNKFDTNEPVQTYYYHIPATLIGDSVKFNIADSNNIPFIDCKMPLSQSGVTAYIQPSCNAPDTTILAFTGLMSGIQQSNPAYRYHQNFQFHSRTSHLNPQLKIGFPTFINMCSDSITFSVVLSSQNSVIAPYPWIALEQSNPLAPPIIFTTVRNASYSNTYNTSDKFIMLPPINPPVGDTVFITAVVDTSHGWGCVTRDSTYVLSILYGNECSNSSHITQPDTNTGCYDKTSTFDFGLFPSSLSLSESSSPQVDSMHCYSRVIFNFNWSNNGSNTLAKPTFSTALPPGIILDSAVFTYASVPHTLKTDDFTHTSGNLSWNLTKDSILKSGFPGTCSPLSNDVSVTMYYQNNCSFVAVTNSFGFSSSGISPCNQLIKSNNINEYPPIHAVDSTCCAVACDNPHNYDVFLKDTNASSLSTQSYSNQTILIKGTFRIDKSVTFIGCNISMAPKAEIVIFSNDTLNLISSATSCTHIHAGCDTMWGSIKVEPSASLITKNIGMSPMHPQTLIEDADSAVVIYNTSTAQGYYNLDSTWFNKDYEDIVITGLYAHKFLGTARSCVFTCRDLSSITNCMLDISDTLNKHNTTLIVPHTLRKTYIGLDIKCDTMYVNHYGIFDNMDYGIISVASNLWVYSNTFQNIGGIAIDFYGSVPTIGRSINVGDVTVTNRNYFYNCYDGVRAKLYVNKANILGNIFTSPPWYNSYQDDNIAIALISGHIRGCVANIKYNTIFQYAAGVYCTWNLYVNATIANNNISRLAYSNACSDFRAVYASEIFMPSTAKYTINSNHISAEYWGIYTTGVKGAIISTNNITVQPIAVCNPPPEIGIKFTASTLCNITDNTVNPDDTVTWSTGWGTYTNLCSDYTYGCNTISNMDTGMHYIGTMTGANMEYNNMYSTTYGMIGTSFIHTGAIGTQGSPGHPYNNSWNGTLFPGSTCFDTSSNPFYSKFWIRCSSCPYDPNINPCSPDTAYTRMTSSVVELPPCGIAGIGSGGGSGSDTVVITHFTHNMLGFYDSIASGQIPITEFHDTTLRLDKYSLQTSIWNNDTLLLYDTLHSFNDSMKHTSLGQIMALDTSIAAMPSGVSPSTYYSGLLTGLDTIVPASNVEANMKTADSIYLVNMISDVDTLSSAQISLLMPIAFKCPYIDGPGVYHARSLVTTYDNPIINFPEDCSVHHSGTHRPIKRKNPKQDSSMEIGINIYPNPNNGNFTLEYQLQSGNIGKVLLFNTLGEVVGEYDLKNSEGKMSIDNLNLNNGVYLYKVFTNNSVIKVGKIIIIK